MRPRRRGRAGRLSVGGGRSAASAVSLGGKQGAGAIWAGAAGLGTMAQRGPGLCEGTISICPQRSGHQQRGGGPAWAEKRAWAARGRAEGIWCVPAAKAEAEIRVFNWHLEVCLALQPFLSRKHLFITRPPFLQVKMILSRSPGVPTPWDPQDARGERAQAALRRSLALLPPGAPLPLPPCHRSPAKRICSPLPPASAPHCLRRLCLLPPWLH